MANPYSTWFSSSCLARISDGPYAGLGAVILGPGGVFMSGLGPPSDYRRRQDPMANDPRPAPSSRAIDRGVFLSNFSDGFRDEAPDLGCCELGVPLPHFGPRLERGSR